MTINPSSLKVSGDRLFIRKDAQVTSAGGIELPAFAQEMVTTGTIVAQGEGRISEGGQRVPMATRVGDKVLFKRHGPLDVLVGDEVLGFMFERDVLAVIE